MNEYIQCKNINIDADKLAEKILDYQYQIQKDLGGRYPARDRQLCLRDIKYHLNYLCSSVAFDSITLFEDYIDWARVLLGGYGLPPRDLANNLESMKKVLSEELPADIRDKVAYFLQQGQKRIKTNTGKVDSFLTTKQKHSRILNQYFQALLAWKKEEALFVVMEALKKQVSIKDLYLKVFQPAQYELGRLWQRGEIDVAGEHYGTALTQFIMSQLYPRILSTAKTGRVFIGTCINGEQHEIGMRMVTDLLEYEGWDTYYLGANTPAGSILGKIKTLKPDLVGISATMLFNVGSVYELIVQIRDSNRNVKIIVGGYPFRQDKDLWKSIGADGCAADLDKVVEICSRLVKGPRLASFTAPKMEFSSNQTKIEDYPSPHSKLFALNNELINMQRQLSKKNIQLDQLNQKLELISMQDSLTQLYNRRYFYQSIKQEINRADRIGYRLVLVLADLNNFKQINDVLGHKAGDNLLIGLAHILQQNLRKGLDTAYRWGGDEFLLTMSNTSKSQAWQVMARIDEKLRKKNSTVSLAWGIIEINSKNLDKIDEFIKKADGMMYEHKKKVKG